jgi:hypothetical protein
MTAYPYYEEHSVKTKLNTETRFIIILIVVVVMGGIVAYIIGFQQGSVTTNAVNNTKETEQPTYIERNSEPAPVGYDYSYTYNDYSYNTKDCSGWLADAYRTGCPEREPVITITEYPTYNDYSYTKDCSGWLADAYRTGCPEPTPVKSTPCQYP